VRRGAGGVAKDGAAALVAAAEDAAALVAAAEDAAALVAAGGSGVAGAPIAADGATEAAAGAVRRLWAVQPATINARATTTTTLRGRRLSITGGAPRGVPAFGSVAVAR
jgi:hypothetical protein